MSAGGYDGPPMPSSFSRLEPRRSSGHVPATYDRPPPVSLPRRPSPSPGSSRRSFDSYPRPRPEGSFRDNASNVYRPTPNSYRPDYTGSFYSRSPSPDPYAPVPTRLSETDVWNRPHAWRPPPVEPISTSWPERKPPPPSPTTSARGRAQRDDMPTRTFEPSDSWKQTHVDHLGRPDHSPTSDRFFDRRGRKSIDGSPERPIRDRGLPFMSGGDRYRPPPPKRDGFLAGRSDSYRPQYDHGRTPIRREPISPSNTSIRRDSGSFTQTRASSRHDSPYTARSVSRKDSRSPHPVISPIHTPSRPIPDTDTWAYPPSVKEDIAARPVSRPLSRSSIASTQVSTKQSSPPPQPLPEPSIPEPPATAAVKQVSKILEPAAAIILEPAKKVEALSPEPPKPSKPPNGTVPSAKAPVPAPAPAPVAIERNIQTPPGLVSFKEKKKSIVEPSVPTVPNTVEQGSVTITPISSQKEAGVPVKIPKKDVHVNGATKPTPAPKAPQATPKPPVSAPVSPPPPSPSPSPPAATPVSTAPAPAAPATPVAPVTAVVPSPPVVPELPLNHVAPLEIKQPQPSYRAPSPKDIEMEIEIPPTTHSPNGDLESMPPATPVIARVVPVVRQRLYPTPEEIPAFSETTTKEEALRIFVMTRLLCNRETREERVNPVLMQNQAIATPLEVHPTATPDSLLDRMFSGQEMEERMTSFIRTRPKLTAYLGQRHGMIDEKIARLREEYLSLQERWVAHCNALNEQQRALASEHEAQHTGRTTRRSTAITDAVRSDFEMEQIIASLGVDDATDPNHLSIRNVATIPDMICVTNGQVDYLFDDTSHRVDNPKEYYAPVRGTEDWKEDEKTTFLEKFAAYPKQFGIIADFLPNKTAAQCVNYYYLHKHKFIDFRKVVSQLAPNKRKRRGVGKKKGNGLLVDIALHDMEVSRAVIAGTPTVSAPPARRGRKAKRTTVVQFEGTPTSTPTPEPESVAPKRGRRRKTAAPTSLATSTTAASASEPPSVAPSVPPSATPSAPPSALTSAPASASPSAPPSVPPSAPPSTVMPPAVPKKVVPPPPTPPASAPPSLSIPVREVHSPEPEPEPRPTKKAKRTRRIKSAATVPDDPPSPSAEADKTLPWLTQTGANGGPVDYGKTANDAYLQFTNMRPPPPPGASQWSEDDKKLFISLLSQHGDNFKRIAASMPNKTTVQVSNFFWDYKAEFGPIAESAPRRSPSPGHDNWNEAMAAGLAAHARNPNSPMASFGYDGQRNFRPPPSSYPEQPRHIMSESVPPHSAPAAISRAQAQHQTYERMSHVLAPPQPPMARLSNNSPPDSRRPILYNGTSSPRGAYPFPNPPDHRDGYTAGKYLDAGHPYMASAPQMQGPPGYYGAAMYTPSAPPQSAPAGYTPAGPVAAGTTAPIIHSPTGMQSPAKLPMPMQPLHGYAEAAAAAHQFYAQAQAPLPGRARADSRGQQQWDGHPYAYGERPPAFGAGKGSGSGSVRNPYPVFNNAAPAGPASTSEPSESAQAKNHYNRT